jgi:hypothetical protein
VFTWSRNSLLLWNPKVHKSFHKNLPLSHVLRFLDAVRTLSHCSLTPISNLCCQIFTSGLSSWWFFDKNVVCKCSFSYACYVFSLVHSVWFNYRNTRRRIQIMNLLIVYSSSVLERWKTYYLSHRSVASSLLNGCSDAPSSEVRMVTYLTDDRKLKTYKGWVACSGIIFIPVLWKFIVWFRRHYGRMTPRWTGGHILI